MKQLLKTMAVGGAALFGLGSVAQAGGGDGTDKSFKPHWIVGSFVGATDTTKGAKATYGLEALYMLNKRVLIGGIAEYLPDAESGKEAQIYLGTVDYMATSHVRLIAGAGAKVKAGNTYDLYRVGAAYDFHFGSLHVAPTASLDFVDGNADVVYGLVFGRAF